MPVLLTLGGPEHGGLRERRDGYGGRRHEPLLRAVHATALEGHLPVPGPTAVRTRQDQPWLVVVQTRKCPAAGAGQPGRAGSAAQCPPRPASGMATRR